MIRFFSDDTPFQLKGKRKVEQWIKQVITLEEKQCGELYYVFVSDKKLLDINRKFLQHDYYTDIITFDNTVENTISGEMYISIDTVRTNAKTWHVTVSDELFRVIIHGILHLCGYNDATEQEQKNMRDMEDKYIKLISNNA